MASVYVQQAELSSGFRGYDYARAERGSCVSEDGMTKHWILTMLAFYDCNCFLNCLIVYCSNHDNVFFHPYYDLSFSLAK